MIGQAYGPPTSLRNEPKVIITVHACKRNVILTSSRKDASGFYNLVICHVAETKNAAKYTDLLIVTRLSECSAGARPFGMQWPSWLSRVRE